MGNYCRDKDAATAAIWLAELAAQLKGRQATLVSYLNEIYAKYGYCHNYLSEIRLLGAKGRDQILLIMKHLREQTIDGFGEFVVEEKIDRFEGEPQPHLCITDTWARDIITYKIKPLASTQSIRVIVRPSGTEPKIKMYFEVFGEPHAVAESDNEKDRIGEIRKRLEKTFMNYCYKLLSVDFPDRGFLVFWQLPLNDKMKYFEIEDDIVALKQLPDTRERRARLDEHLAFLGANPVTKVDKAFMEKYKVGILEYLGLN